MNKNHKNKKTDRISESGITNELRQIEKIDVSKDENALIQAFNTFRIFFATQSYEKFYIRFQILDALSKYTGSPYLTKKMIQALVPALTEEEITKALRVLTKAGFLESEGNRYIMTKHSRLSIQLLNLIILFLAREAEGKQLEYLEGLGDFEKRMGLDTGAIFRAISHLTQEVNELQKAKSSDSPIIIRRALKSTQQTGKIYDNLIEKAMELPDSELSILIQKNIHDATSRAHETVAAIDKSVATQSINQMSLEWLGTIPPRNIEQWLINADVESLASHLGRQIKVLPTAFMIIEDDLIESYQLLMTGEMEVERPLPETVLADYQIVDKIESDWPLDVISREIDENLQKSDPISLAKFVPEESWEVSCSRMHSISMLSSHNVYSVKVKDMEDIGKYGIKLMTDGDLSAKRNE